MCPLWLSFDGESKWVGLLKFLAPYDIVLFYDRSFSQDILCMHRYSWAERLCRLWQGCCSLPCFSTCHSPRSAFRPNSNTLLSVVCRKKLNATTISWKYYRLVSNAPFLFKLLENLVHNQLQHHLTTVFIERKITVQCHLTRNNATLQFRSVYQQIHSTETAVNKLLPPTGGWSKTGVLSLHSVSWGPIHKKSYDKLRKNLG